ncbi:MAG: hypothetical protein JXA60_10280 [Candidatus Coatesbacteria bacterium]|nr:hypothetical protein [Candidatus Coatesbacteria bacterium]
MVSKNVRWQLAIILFLLLLFEAGLEAEEEIEINLGEIKISGGTGLDLMLTRKFSDTGEVKIDREFFRDLMRPIEKSTFLDNIYPAPVPVFANLIGGSLSYHELHNLRVFSAGRITTGTQTLSKQKEEMDELKPKIDPFDEWFSKDERQFFFRNESFYKFIWDSKIGKVSDYKDERTRGLLQGRYFSELYIIDFNVLYDYKKIESADSLTVQPRDFLYGSGSFGYRISKTSRFEVGMLGNSFSLKNEDSFGRYQETMIGGLGRLHVGSKTVDAEFSAEGGGGRITYDAANGDNINEISNRYTMGDFGGNLTIKADKLRFIPGVNIVYDKKWATKVNPQGLIEYYFTPVSRIYAGGGGDVFRTRLWEEAPNLSFVQIDSTYGRDEYYYGLGGFTVELPYVLLLKAEGFFRSYKQRFYWTSSGLADSTSTEYSWRLAQADSSTSLFGFDVSVNHNFVPEVYHELRYGFRKSSFTLPYENAHVVHYMIGYRKDKNIDIAGGGDYVMVNNTPSGNLGLPFAKVRFSKYLLSDILVLFLSGSYPFKKEAYKFYLDYPHEGPIVEGGVILVLPIR